jgi:hypothetical protein
MKERMTDFTPMIVFAALLALVIPAFIISVIMERKRREGLWALAGRLGLSFDEGQNEVIPLRYGFLKNFNTGDNRYATNILAGNYQSDSVLAFDYHYETYTEDKNGRHTEHHWFSVFVLEMPGSEFPELTIRHENFLLRVAEVFGYQDIKFESAEFSKVFCVRSEDKKFAYDVCNPAMMEYLLGHRDLSLQIEDEVIAIVYNNRLSVEQFEPNLQRLVEVRNRLPQYLFADK